MLKAFQLRAARSTLGLGVRDIGAYLNLSRTTISKVENLDNLCDIPINKDQNILLTRIFNDKGIIFPNSHSLSFKKIDIIQSQYITRFQLRGSRSILSLSQRELSIALGIDKNDLNYLENLDNKLSISRTKKIIDTDKILSYFTQQGLSFPDNATIVIKDIDNDSL